MVIARNVVTKQSHKNLDCHALRARALKDDLAILRKCPWGAMTVIVGMVRETSTTICAVREQKLGLANPLCTGVPLILIYQADYFL